MASKNSESAASDPVHAARRKNLDLALQQIAKDYGEGAIMRLGDDKVAPVEVIPTGNILIARYERSLLHASVLYTAVTV